MEVSKLTPPLTLPEAREPDHEAPRRPSRRVARAGGGGADVLVPARRRRRARHQDRAAGGRFRPRLRRSRPRRERLFRVAQPRQGIPRPRSHHAGGQGAARGDARQGRRVHPEPQARRGGAARLCARPAAARSSAAHHLLGVGLWRDRALCAAQGLRPPDPGRSRPRLGHRRPGGAGAGRRLGGRHRGRHERLRGDPRSADRARANRAGRRTSRSRCSTPWPTG